MNNNKLNNKCLNRPDPILIDKQEKHWNIVDFSVPNDANVEEKEKEKIAHLWPTR